MKPKCRKQLGKTSRAVQRSKKRQASGLHDHYDRLDNLSPNSRRFLVTRVVHVTDKAILLEINKKSYWFPNSVIKFGVHPSGNSFAVDIPGYVALQKRLIVRI